MIVTLCVNDLIALDGRLVRLCGMPDHVTLCRDHRKRIAVRNVATNRLSYVPEWRLVNAVTTAVTSAVVRF